MEEMRVEIRKLGEGMKRRRKKGRDGKKTFYYSIEGVTGKKSCSLEG